MPVFGLLDSAGHYVVKYRYDAWGNVLCKSVIINCIASNHNPFLYKGYMYDEETGWYYLQSRYYMPRFCRFLSPDEIDYTDPLTIGGLNLYAYCYNSPISFVDSTGSYPVIASLHSVSSQDSSSMIEIPGFDELSYAVTGIEQFLNSLGGFLEKLGWAMYHQNVIANDITVSNITVKNTLNLANVQIAKNLLCDSAAVENIQYVFKAMGITLFAMGIAIDVSNDINDPSLSKEQKIALAVSDICIQGAIFAMSFVCPAAAIVGIFAQLIYRRYIRKMIVEVTK